MNLLTMKEAASLPLFPAGAVSEASLRREAKRGNLAVYVVARKTFTTEDDIREMIIKCRAKQQDCAYTSEKSGETNRGASLTKQHGSSGKQESPISPQAAALASVEKLIASSRNTSQAGIERQGANVAYLKSQSQT